jgi:predicted Zn finger-like uncharacterized protein
MQITCPTCATRYNLPDHSVPPSGRKVKCRSCGHVWMQFPPAAEEDDPFERTALFTAADTSAGEDLTEVRPVRAMPAAASYRDSDAKPKRRAPLPGVGWIALAASLAAVIGGGVVAREQVVHLWPPANLLYKTAGLEVLPPGAGLQLQNSRSEQRQEGGATILVVEGQIVNVSDRPQKVPRVKATALDSRQKPLQTWIIDASAASLQPGEIATFFSAQRDPGPAAVLKLTFDIAGVVAERM